ncbi:hypothetical protein chiPu_0001255 [Chiloscyllium punctatum]|uniref:Uncharacterized protein n=1 Tax=Chiloscyllium punctatum TaxID=137246 RepID=A0A401RXK2_CHIPU|nr:hypothetical protein [Chiloscyllium punctatum]
MTRERADQQGGSECLLGQSGDPDTRYEAFVGYWLSVLISHAHIHLESNGDCTTLQRYLPAGIIEGGIWQNQD